MADGSVTPARTAEIYGYVRGRWELLDTLVDAPRDEALHRGRACFARPEVEAVRILVERTDGSGAARPFVAYRAQKSDVPEFDLLASRPGVPRPSAARALPMRPGNADDIAEGLPPIPPPLVPADAPARRPSGRQLLKGALAGIATLCLGFLTMQHAVSDGGGTSGASSSAVAVAVLIAAGLLLVRELNRLDPAAAPPPERTREPLPVPAVPAEAPSAEAPSMEAAPADMASTDAAAVPPDRNSLFPVLRLLADALARTDGEMPDTVSDEATRLGIRLYAAGAAAEHARRSGGASGRDPVTDCLLLLGEREDEASRFAAALDDLLLAPEAQALYRAGREDLTALASGDKGAGAELGPALAAWIEAAAAGGRAGGRAGNLVVLAVAPLHPSHAPVIEAVVGAFGGRGFTRDGTAVTAGFVALETALDAARAIRDAIRASPEPAGMVAGCGLTIAVEPRPGGIHPAPAASAALALARAAPGEVVATPVLRTVLAARGAALNYAPLPGSGGYLLAEAS
ncbi:hypothetical protein [Arenibaculum sp.]|jgi:hypothetical protein|uniref:hypothetical protein n=1 Tax=Arenibaculum sp. TaxID=2865862 RepID=UPI002E107327|nr:hypothetical protein [Arenibaculum sp.]